MNTTHQIKCCHLSTHIYTVPCVLVRVCACKCVSKYLTESMKREKERAAFERARVFVFYQFLCVRFSFWLFHIKRALYIQTFKLWYNLQNFVFDYCVPFIWYIHMHSKVNSYESVWIFWNCAAITFASSNWTEKETKKLYLNSMTIWFFSSKLSKQCHMR